jgi:hypothetical protein
MTIPSLLFGLVFASLYGALFHLVRGGRPARLLLFMGLSWLGFALGHIIGNWLLGFAVSDRIGIWRGWILFPVGSLNFGAATIGSILLLALSLINFRRLLKRGDAV